MRLQKIFKNRILQSVGLQRTLETIKPKFLYWLFIPCFGHEIFSIEEIKVFLSQGSFGDVITEINKQNSICCSPNNIAEVMNLRLRVNFDVMEKKCNILTENNWCLFKKWLCDLSVVAYMHIPRKFLDGGHLISFDRNICRSRNQKNLKYPGLEWWRITQILGKIE